MSQRVFVTAIIAAGGRGQRFGGARPKQLLPFGGLSPLERCVRTFAAHPAIDEIVVALPPEIAADPPTYLQRSGKPLTVVAGGSRRQDSVANAFRAGSERADVVVIHDAARPFASAALIERTIAAAVESGAAVAALPVHDTVKQGRASPAPGGGEPGSPRGTAGARSWVVETTLPRETIFLAQTPQAFRRDVLRAALATGGAGDDRTDEATLAERAGYRVQLVEGEMTNIKITTPSDVPVAEGIANAAEGVARGVDGGLRVGNGYDLHRLVRGRPLMLGGVLIPFDYGLLGHSDADAVCHAVTDAILGAASAGDIGRHFPDTDPQWRKASSLDLLGRAVALARAKGLTVVNVDVVVMAERPKLAPHVDAMRANVAAALGTEVDRVSIKSKTNEGLGEVGRGEAIAAHAVALLATR